MEPTLRGPGGMPVIDRGGVMSNLGRRQRQVALLVALGETNGEIAAALGLSVFTVRNEVIGILRKLSIRNRSRLAFLIGQDQIAVES